MIVDSHVHVWDASRFPLTWTRANPRLQRSHSGADYIQEARSAGIQGAILVEVDVAPEHRRAEAEDLAERCTRADATAIAAVVCCDPRDSAFIANMEAIRHHHTIRGVRWIARTPVIAEAMCDSAMVRHNLAYLGTIGLTFDLNVPTLALPALVPLLAACPSTRFVLDHCGYADPIAFGAAGSRVASHDAESWQTTITALAAFDNVACKVSGLISRLEPNAWTTAAFAPIVNVLRNAFGSERLLFGSDWPVCGAPGALVAWVTALQQIASSWPAQEQQHVFASSAHHWYDIAQG